MPEQSFADKSDKEKSPDELKEEILEQRRASQRYFNNNFYSEWAEIYKNIHGRVRPNMYKDKESGELREDHTRTNVCTPDHFNMLRRGTSRLTRNPPNLRVRGGPDNPQGQAMRDKTSAKLMFNWDRAESQRAFKKIVNVAYGIGWGIGKSYYDEVPVVRQLRKLTTTLEPKDFNNLANSDDEQVSGLVQRFGDRLKDQTPFSEQEMSMMVETMGDQTSLKVSTMRYRGPVLDAPFSGDVFPEPGFHSLNESGYVTEMSIRDIDFLKYWSKVNSINPLTGESKPVFSEDACQKVLDKAGSRRFVEDNEISLRRLMREEIELADPSTSGKPIKAPRKRVLIDERHTIISGHLCVDFIGEESEYLGRLWYPWETYGRYVYSEMVLIPDWLGGFGQSTLIVTRFLQQLRNVRLNQTTDFINNKLLPLLKHRRGDDNTAYDVRRTGFGRLLEVDNMADYDFMADPAFPSEAWQDQAQYKLDMQEADPSTVDYSPGTSEQPGPGKFATTARLADKAADNVTSDTLDQVGLFIRDVVELQLWMDQQAMSEPVDVPREYFERIDAISLRTQGSQARVIRVSPMDIQEDLEILPEQGSTLAADDEFRVAGLQQFAAIGERHPDIVNMRAVIKKLAEATPGINAEDIILPPPPPQPPVPPVTLNISLSIKWEELAPDVQAAILQHEGLPAELTTAKGIGHMLDETADAADSAARLEEPVNHDVQPPMQAKPNGKGKPNGSGARK
jgi:hypothetical protein